MPQVDFTLEDLKQVFATKEEQRSDFERVERNFECVEHNIGRVEHKIELVEHKIERVEHKIELVENKIGSVKDMLEDDARAEGKRLDRVDRRSLSTARRLEAHKADSSVHGGGNG